MSRDLWKLAKWAFTSQDGFGGPKSKPMTPPPDPPEKTDRPIQEAEKERKQQKVAARGYSKSIATSPMGVTGEQNATGQAQKLG